MEANLAEALAAAFQQAITAAISTAVPQPPPASNPVSNDSMVQSAGQAAQLSASAPVVATGVATSGGALSAFCTSTVLSSATDSLVQALGLEDIPDYQLEVGELDKILHPKKVKRKRPKPLDESGQGCVPSNTNTSTKKAKVAHVGSTAENNMGGGQHPTFYPTDSIKIVKNRKMIF